MEITTTTEISIQRFGLGQPGFGGTARRQIGVEETERMRWLDHTHSGSALLPYDLIAERLHPSPMHFGTEMMFGVVSIIQPDPIVELVITAHPPGDRLVWVPSKM